MACNCKKASIINEKYGGGKEVGIRKAVGMASAILLRLAIFCLVFALMAAVAPIILAYAMVCLAVGKKISLKLPRIKRNVR